MAPAKSRSVAICLVGLAGALLLVGVVSGTFLRHVVQVLPIAMALALLGRRPQWGANAAIPIFACWTAIVVLIWLFLLGLSTFAQGRYSPGELTLTAFIAGFSMAGIAAAFARGRGMGAAERVLVVAGFAVLQFVAMWLSFRPALAQD